MDPRALHVSAQVPRQKGERTAWALQGPWGLVTLAAAKRPSAAGEECGADGRSAESDAAQKSICSNHSKLLGDSRVTKATAHFVSGITYALWAGTERGRALVSPVCGHGPPTHSPAFSSL